MSERRPQGAPNESPPSSGGDSGDLSFSSDELAEMGAEWSSPTTDSPMPQAMSSSWTPVSNLGNLAPPAEEQEVAEELVEVDELGLELAFGVHPDETDAQVPDDPEPEPMFRADDIEIADADAVLPFIVPDEHRPKLPVPGLEPTPATPRAKPAPPPPWFERFFDADFLEFEPQPNQRFTSREVDFIAASLALTEGARLLDLCCGTGRHTIELVARGYEAVGIDLSRVMLDRATEQSRARKLAVNFVHTDVRNLAFRRIFDAVLLWGASFGYFRDAENAQVLRKVAHALRPGGRVLLQVPNRDFFLRDVPRSRWRRDESALILDEVDFDWRSSRFRARRSILRSDGRERIDTLDFRGYSLHELVDLLASEGFVPLEVSGRITSRGAYFGAESPSLIVLAEVR